MTESMIKENKDLEKKVKHFGNIVNQKEKEIKINTLEIKTILERLEAFEKDYEEIIKNKKDKSKDTDKIVPDMEVNNVNKGSHSFN